MPERVELELGSPIAIMPGRSPLGIADLEGKVARFSQEHGALPVLVLVPRELRPGEALSWSAFLALPDGAASSSPASPKAQGKGRP